MKQIKYLPIIIAIVMAILFGYHLQSTQEFIFYFREQLMVFYNDADIIMSRYLGVGGLGLLLTHWFTQFFILEYAGAIITAILGVLAALLLWKSLQKQNSSLIMLPLWMLPAIFQCDALFDVYYAYQGYVAYFLFAVFAFIYRLIVNHIENYNYRILTAVILILTLFYVGGAIAALLSVYVFVLELLENPRKCWMMIVPIAVMLVASKFCVDKAYLPLYRDALLNSAYYEPILDPTNFFHTSWILILVIPFLAPLIEHLDNKIKPIMKILCSVVVLAAVSTFAAFSSNRNQQKMYPMMAMDHYIVNQEWKKLLNSPYCNSSNFILMNRVNLALSHEGRLLDDFYKYPQLTSYSLVTDLENLSLDVEITSTVCEIYWNLDNIASADERAFNSYEGLRYGSPSNLKMLVKTSLVFGRYAQAEKYIKMLEKTTFYKEWASGQRKYLYNDDAVEADPVYGAKRKSLPIGTRDFVQARGPYADLLVTLRANPKAIAARDYAIGYLILANDVNHINSFTEEFYGTEVMPTTPLRLQEAVLAANERDLEYCRAHGVEEKTINDYQELKKNYLQAKESGIDPAAALRPWRHTYWYFLLVTSNRLAKVREQMIKQQEEQQKTDNQQVGAHG